MNYRHVSITTGIMLAFGSAATAATSTLQINTNNGLFGEFSDGTATSNTSVFIGAYSGSTITSSTSLNEFLGGFTSFDSGIFLTNSDSTSAGGFVEGYFGDEGIQFIIDENDFAFGTQVYALFIDVTDFANASTAGEFAIVTDSSWQLLDDDGGGVLTNVNLNTFGGGGLSSSNVEVGSLDSLTVTNPPSVVSGDFTSIQLVAVPEPSSTALLGLAFSSLLWRRKRS